jgi:hypothetical protein
MKRSFILLLLATTAFSCKKDTGLNPNGKVELYLLESFSTTGNSCQIDESTAVIQEEPFIAYADFLSYDSNEYIFEISVDARETINSTQYPVNGTAFAVMANDTLVYTGYFWPAYSSASCEWVVIDPLLAGIGNKIAVRLGYPGALPGQSIPDKRNDERIIRIFKQDKKLK